MRAFEISPIDAPGFRISHCAILGQSACRTALGELWGARLDGQMEMHTPDQTPNLMGSNFAKCAVCWVDDVLCCGINPEGQMDEISGKFTQKNGSVEESKMSGSRIAHPTKSSFCNKRLNALNARKKQNQGRNSA